MNRDINIYKGHIVHTPTKDKFEIFENGYIIVDENGKVDSILKTLPMKYQDRPITNYGNKLIIPAFTDLHIHSGQYPNRGLCLDLPLMDWLIKCTFPIESKFRNQNLARNVYSKFIKQLWKNGNLRSVVYDTTFVESTKILFDMFILSGMSAYIGKASQDVNVPDYIKENTEQSLIDNEMFILETKNRSNLVKPAIYPRFAPSCSPKLLSGLGELSQKYNVPVISHLSESLSEIELVNELYPGFPTYADIYNYYGLLGQEPTVMAHCVYSDERERKLLKENDVWVAHSPNSNLNLGSGLMQTRKFIDEGLKVALASDIGASAQISIHIAMNTAIATSKIVWLYSNEELEPIKTHEAFYFGTKGGGSFFGKVGSFEKGYEFDALVIDDNELLDMEYTIQERVERFIYLGKSEFIISRYLSGNRIPEPIF